MTRQSWDRLFGVVFAAAGAAVAIVGAGLPRGIAGVPGPGLFPLGIGCVLAALGLGLIASARGGDPYFDRGIRTPAARQTLATVALLGVYVATWSAVPFAWRTPILLVALFRVFGESRRRSLLFAGLITAALLGLFQVLFRVRL